MLWNQRARVGRHGFLAGPNCISTNTDTGLRCDWSLRSDEFLDPAVSVLVVASKRADDEVMRVWNEHGTTQSRPVRRPTRVRAVDRWVSTRVTAALLSDVGFDAGCRRRTSRDHARRMASAVELRGAGLDEDLALPHRHEPFSEHAAHR